MIEADGRFGRYLSTVMADNGVDTRDVAALVDSTYEHIRKLIMSKANPSEWMMQKMAGKLKGFNAKEASKLVDMDKAQKKFKGNFTEMAGLPADADIILKDWGYLSDEQKKMVTTQVAAFAKYNRGVIPQIDRYRDRGKTREKRG